MNKHSKTLPTRRRLRPLHLNNEILWQHVSVEFFTGKDEQYWESTCNWCADEFDMNTITIVTSTFRERYHPICYCNTDNFNLYGIPQCTSYLKNYNNLDNQYQVIINETLFKTMITPPNKRYPLALPNAQFDNLSHDHYIKLAKQLDIDAWTQHNVYSEPQLLVHVIKTTLAKNLSSDATKLRHKQLVWGYCHQTEQSLKINFSHYLVKIVHSFCPVYIE